MIVRKNTGTGWVHVCDVCFHSWEGRKGVDNKIKCRGCGVVVEPAIDAFQGMVESTPDGCLLVTDGVVI